VRNFLQDSANPDAENIGVEEETTMANLDNTLDALTKPDLMTREEFWEKLLTEKEFFADYAWKFMGSSAGYNSGLLDWSWERYQAENTPEYTKAWKDEPAPKPKSYDFNKTWLQELYGGGEGR
jgi:hypothetical protein